MSLEDAENYNVGLIGLSFHVQLFIKVRSLGSIIWSGLNQKKRIMNDAATRSAYQECFTVGSIRKLRGRNSKVT
jgi:hypothetical protein